MWTAKVLNSSYQNGVLIVNMEYTNGTITIPEVIDMTGGTMENLSRRVQARLDGFAATDALNAQIASGPFTPVIPPPTDEEVFAANVRQAQKEKAIKDLGIAIPTPKTEAVKAIQEAVAADPIIIQSAPLF